jgi:hypothetical protein
VPGASAWYTFGPKRRVNHFVADERQRLVHQLGTSYVVRVIAHHGESCSTASMPSNSPRRYKPPPEPQPRVVEAKTIQEWQDLPVDFILWKFAEDEPRDLVRSLVADLNADPVLSNAWEKGRNRLGEDIDVYRLPLSVRLTSRRGWGTASWDLIVSVVGVTADVMAVAGGTFAVAEFASSAWRRLRQRAQEQEVSLHLSVGSETAAALLAVDWLKENDPDLAAALTAAQDTHLHATDHGSYFVVTLIARRTDTSDVVHKLFLVTTDGGSVMDVPLPPSLEGNA